MGVLRAWAQHPGKQLQALPELVTHHDNHLQSDQNPAKKRTNLGVPRACAPQPCALQRVPQPMLLTMAEHLRVAVHLQVLAERLACRVSTLPVGSS